MRSCYALFLMALMMFTGISSVYADDSEQADGCTALKATMPAAEAAIKSVDSQVLACLANEQSSNVIRIRISYNSVGKIQEISVKNAKKDIARCIKKSLKDVALGFDVNSIMQKRMKESMPAKPAPKHHKNERGELVFDGYDRRVTVPAYMPDGKITYIYNSKDKTMAIKSHYMIGRVRGGGQSNCH